MEGIPLTEGDLAARMMAALDAAQTAGGDFRGKQSAALLVLSGIPTGKLWQDRKIDLRVDDHREPLKELWRLLRVHRAYQLMHEADRELKAGRTENGNVELFSGGAHVPPERGDDVLACGHAGQVR